MYLNYARLESRRSIDPSTQCGAVLVETSRDGNWIVGKGHNSPPQSFIDAIDEEAEEDGEHMGLLQFAYLRNRDFRLSVTVHAEINAMAHVSLGLGSHIRHVMYVWPMPSCGQCMAAMAKKGVNRVVSVIPTDSQSARWQNQWDHAGIIAGACGIRLDCYPSNVVDDWRNRND